MQGKRNLLWCFAPDGERVEPQQLPKLLPETVAGEAGQRCACTSTMSRHEFAAM